MRSFTQTSSHTASQPHARTHTLTAPQSHRALHRTSPCPALCWQGLLVHAHGPARPHLPRPPPPAPSALALCPGLCSLQPRGPLWGWLRPGTNGRRGVKQGGFRPIGASDCQSPPPHLCRTLPVRSRTKEAARGQSPGAGFLGPCLKACPPGTARLKSLRPLPLPSARKQSLKFSRSGATGQVTGQV